MVLMTSEVLGKEGFKVNLHVSIDAVTRIHISTASNNV